MLDALVELVEPTGAETMIGLRHGEREIVARFDPDDAPRVGETITLALDMAKACLFDAQSERLIG
jgi:multiple sugar transport system ATP-binding protein